jgi:diadenosine tetraphosphate (Ap4A) HIT family hydrolase
MTRHASPGKELAAERQSHGVAGRPVAGCELCAAAVPPGTVEIVATECLRVLRVIDAQGFPAFYRVVWRDHVAEFSDLSPRQRGMCMEAVATVERCLRALSPRKVNLAALGNIVPHLHWHVIARFEWDSHFPAPIWAPERRPVPHAQVASLDAGMEGVDTVVARAIGAAYPPPERTLA